MDKSEILKTITGPFGALCLACVMLWSLMQSYQGLIDKIMSEHADDRMIYKETMSKLSQDLSTLNSQGNIIHNEIKELRMDVKK
jgi:hypothetical protein